MRERKAEEIAGKPKLSDHTISRQLVQFYRYVNVERVDLELGVYGCYDGGVRVKSVWRWR